jgi:DNA-binding MarR family transcriptional regulator
MPTLGGQWPLLPLSGDGANGVLQAGDLIDATCRLAIAGKLALRDIAAWIRGRPINETEFRLLWLLFQHEKRSSSSRAALDQGELAAGLALSPAQISGLVERLQGAALISHVPHGFDRRRQLWRLSQGGESLVQDVVASVQASDRAQSTAVPPLAPPLDGGGLTEAAA